MDGIRYKRWNTQKTVADGLGITKNLSSAELDVLSVEDDMLRNKE
jgi:hypothetical protein